MAFIVGGDMITKGDTRSALSRADFDRQRDIYKLAAKGIGSCRRLWNDFEREDPAAARLVIADVRAEKSRDVEANRHLDVVLAKAEKPKKAKPEKPSKAAAREQEAFLKSLLNSPDPAEREYAWKALGL